MLASSTQETAEKAESAGGVKSVKPPIKPKPIVPAKPRQTPFLVPQLSSSSGPPCSPTSDIPSAVKISQLTGPQPYGTRRASVRKWSSTVEDADPDNNELKSPLETSAPASPGKAVTQPLTAPGRPLSSGPAWKGKSPFMLTTRGWGEQRKSQVKDDHESASANQKPSYNSAAQDTDAKKDVTVPVEENAVVNVSSSAAGVVENTEGTNELLSTSIPVTVKKAPAVTPRKPKITELPDKVIKTKESSLETNLSSTGDVSNETVKHSYEAGHIQDTKSNAQETTSKTDFSDHSSQEKVNKSVQIKDEKKPLQNIDEKLPENVSVQDKDLKKPLIVSSDVNSGYVHLLEEGPLSLSTERKDQYGNRQNEHENREQLKSRTKEEQNAGAEYLQALQSPEYTNKIKSEDEIPEKFKGIEEPLASSGSVAEHGIYSETSGENKDTTATLLPSVAHQDFPAERTYSSYIPHSDDEHGHHFHHTQQEDDTSVQSGGSVSHPASEIMEKPREHPAEKRSVHEKNEVFSLDNKLPSAPALPRPPDTGTDPHPSMASEIQDKGYLVSGEGEAYLGDTSGQASHGYVEKNILTTPEETPSQSSYDPNYMGLGSDDSPLKQSKSSSHNDAERVRHSAEISDKHNQETFYKPHSTEQTEHQEELEKTKTRESDEPQHTYGRSEEPRYTHQSDVPWDIYKKSEEPQNSNYEPDEPQCVHSKTQEPEYSHYQYDDPQLVHNKPEELEYSHYQSDEPQDTRNKSESEYSHYQAAEPKHVHNKTEEPKYSHYQPDEPKHVQNKTEEPEYTHYQPDEPQDIHKKSESENRHYQYDEPQHVLSKTQEQEYSHYKHDEPQHVLSKTQEPEYSHYQPDEPQHVQNKSEEPKYSHYQPDEPRPTGKKTQEPDYSHYQYDEPQHTRKKSDELEHSHYQYDEPQYTHNKSEESEYSHFQSDEPQHTRSKTEDHHYESNEPQHVQNKSEEQKYSHYQPDEPQYTHYKSVEPQYTHYKSDDPQYTHYQSEESQHTHYQSEESQHTHYKSDEPQYTHYQSEESQHTHYKTDEPQYTHYKSDEPKYTHYKSDEPQYTHYQSEESQRTHYKSSDPQHIHFESEEQSQTHAKEPKIDQEDVSRYAQSDEPVQHLEDFGKILGGSEEPSHAKEPKPKYEESQGKVNIYDQLEEKNKIVHSPEASVHTKKPLEEPDESLSKSKHPEEPEFKPPSHSPDKYNLSNESVQNYQPPAVLVSKPEMYQEFSKVEEMLHRKSQLDRPGKSEQSGESINAHQASMPEAVRMYEHSEQKDTVKQSEGVIYPVHQHGDLGEPSFVKEEDHKPQDDLLPMQQQNETRGISAGSSEKGILEGNLKEEPIISYTEPLTNEELGRKKALEKHDHRPEEPHLFSNQKQETTSYSKEGEHGDGLPEKPTSEELLRKTKEPDEIPEKTPEDKVSNQGTILNGHAEHGDLHSGDELDKAKENNAEEPKETEPEENFDFLEGTTILDTSCMRFRASLGRKRCHRTPVAEIGASEEEKSHEYWMFRDSTEPKSQLQTRPERDEEEMEQEKSPQVTPDNSPSPGKSPKKGGLFAGIKSPAILKGRLKPRNKASENETSKQEADESKSPTKENPESSSSLNWLQALKIKKKKQPK